jgi:sortase A
MRHPKVKHLFYKKRSKGFIALGVLVVLIGLFVGSFPWIRAQYYDYKQVQLMNAWNTSQLLNSTEGPNIAVGMSVTPLPTASPQTPAQPVKKVDSDGVLEENTNPDFDNTYILSNMEGVLTINSIDVNSPILNGNSANNLDVGIVHLVGSADMGADGNYILAGHKSRIYGRHFSRLHEMKIGDLVQVTNGLNTYQYQVTEIKHVTANDTSVLADSADPIITLITCDYTQTPIGRLVVIGKLIALN